MEGHNLYRGLVLSNTISKPIDNLRPSVFLPFDSDEQASLQPKGADAPCGARRTVSVHREVE